MGLASVNEILDEKFSISSAELVMVNILAPIIKRLFNQGLNNLIKSDGYLILSGILDTQSDEIIQMAEDLGLKFVKKELINDWVGLVFRK
ncbi:MAG TPA: 50S ribosomal protein L11 methyltransferase [Anaerolineaceae bacterium]|nr:50S ribosomal protein L11 methyltransferase [Anaerolineaceae bacterium]